MQILEQLRQIGVRATEPRRYILEALQASRKPMSVEAIWKSVKKRGVDRVTVYRSLETLAKHGLVRTIDLGHAHIHYEINDPANHHHHLICESCGNIQDITFNEEQGVIQKLEQRHKFQTRSHAFELFGLCAECM